MEHGGNARSNLWCVVFIAVATVVFAAHGVCADAVMVDIRIGDSVFLEGYGGGNRSLLIENDTGLELRLWVADLDDIVTTTVKGISGNADYIQRRPKRTYFIVPKSGGEVDVDSGKHMYELYRSPEGCRVQLVDTIAVPQGYFRLRITRPTANSDS